jgi:1,4-alpha-glucan branching enzyme
MSHMSNSEIERVVTLTHDDPHRLLGPHLEDGKLVMRAFCPGVRELAVVFDGGERTPMVQVHPAGLFELRTDDDARPAPSRYELEPGGEASLRYRDPYGFWPTLGELDLHLVGEGRHRELWRWLGAHSRTHQDVTGTAFAVWAPSAKRVSVVGDFNDWDGRRHAMRCLGAGIWELFVPDVGDGALYKYELVGADGELIVKADPLGQAMQLRPQTASQVSVSRHTWQDDDWMKARREHAAAQSPMAIYEVHLGAWRQHTGEQRQAGQPNWYSYRELAEHLVDYVSELGFTHLELMPIMEHPFDGSWGYQVGGYYAPTSRYGSPDDFRYFIDRCHQKGIGVILDWVPAHFPKDAFGLGRFDGTALYEHLDSRRGEHRQWGTYVFNYGRHEVRNFLIANAIYWLEEFHIDGLRADAVASMLYLDYAATSPDEWEPNEQGGRENLEAISFVRELNDTVHERCPGCMVIAEESTSWPGVTHATSAGGLGFDLKWNMGWMHDTLDYFEKNPIHRSYHHNLLTFGLMYAFSERFVLPLSHDEVVHLKKSLLSKMAGDRWRMFANLRALFAHMWAHPGKKLLFMGGELGQWEEWDESAELDWGLLEEPDHAGLQRLIKDLNQAYRSHPALYRADHHPAGFRWIDANDTNQSVISYLRYGGPEQGAHDYVMCLANLTPLSREGYRLGVPSGARHREILNTDAGVYGGSGVGNLGVVTPSDVPSHGFAHSLELTLPPLAVLWLVPE